MNCPLEFRKIFVRNLSFDTNNFMLREFFSTFGPIESVQVVYDKRVIGKKCSRGFGFVVFTDSRSARKALVEGEKELRGRTVECFWSATGERGSKYATAEEEVLSLL